MKPRTALALDIACWLGLTLGLLSFEHYKTAAVVGAFAIVYLWRCVVTMLRIIKIEQTLHDFDVDDERDYH